MGSHARDEQPVPRVLQTMAQGVPAGSYLRVAVREGPLVAKMIYGTSMKREAPRNLSEMPRRKRGLCVWIVLCALALLSDRITLG